MATLKQRHKQELKALNLECEQRVQGKKGEERTIEVRRTEQLKRELLQKHAQEIEEEKQREAEKAEDENDQNVQDSATDNTAPQEKKIPKARLRQMKKEAKEEEERKKQQEELAKKGPTLREKEMNALIAQIAKFRLQLNEIPGDGNCLYGAIADQVSIHDGHNHSIQQLRAMAVEEMRANPDLFVPFLQEDETLDTYCKKVLTPGEWGGELEIRALSMALKKQIWVHRINSPIIKMGEDEGFDGSTPLHVTYHQHLFALGEHYNSAVPIENTRD